MPTPRYSIISPDDSATHRWAVCDCESKDSPNAIVAIFFTRIEGAEKEATDLCERLNQS